MLGLYALQSQLYRMFPFYRQVGAGGGVLFLAEGGRWSIIEEPIVIGEEPIIRSRSTNSLSTPSNTTWELQDMHGGKWNSELSLLVIQCSPEGSI